MRKLTELFTTGIAMTGNCGLKLVRCFFDWRRFYCFCLLLQIHFLFKHRGFEFEEWQLGRIDVGAFLHTPESLVQNFGCCPERISPVHYTPPSRGWMQKM